MGHAEIHGSHPVGTRLRLVIAPGGLAGIDALLRPLGATLRPATPDFEDVFLARTAAGA